MTAGALLQQLHTLAVVVTPTPKGDLSVKAPKGVMTDALRLAIRDQKVELLALLQGPPGRVPVSCCTRIGPHNPVKQFHPVTREPQWRCTLCNALQEVLSCRTSPSFGARRAHRRFPRPRAVCARHIAQHAALVQMIYGPRPGERCLLCAGMPVCRGIFTPRNSLLYGGNTAQQRLLSYALCAVHMQHPDLDVIEARLLVHCRQRAAPWN